MLQLVVIQKDLETDALGVMAGGLEMKDEGDVMAALAMVDLARVALNAQLVELQVQRRMAPPAGEKEE